MFAGADPPASCRVLGEDPQINVIQISVRLGAMVLHLDEIPCLKWVVFQGI